MAGGGHAGSARGGGRAAWVAGGDLDLVGDLWADLSLPLTGENALFASIDSRTAIEKATSDLTFLVRDVEYDLRSGWRGRRFSAFVGERGLAFVDAEGQPSVRYAAGGFESVGARFGGRIAAGPVWDERQVEADAVVLGGAEARLSRLGTRGAALWLDAELDGLVDGGRLLADASVGPRLVFPVAGGMRASFFAHYQRSRNPLGLLDDAWLLGLTYEDGPDAVRSDGAPPAIDGRVALGGGGGRLAGELLLRFLSPPFAGNTRGVFAVDANVLTAEDTNELYYLYHLGLERELGGFVAGGYFYHRSNHVLAEPNDQVTSINVAEAGFETPGWLGRVRSSSPRVGLDFRLRAGFLIDSSFGEDERWHVRGGLRLSLPWGGAQFVPYVVAEAEAGDVGNETLGIGTAIARDAEVQLEYRNDQQFFGNDPEAVVLTVRYSL